MEGRPGEHNGRAGYAEMLRLFALILVAAMVFAICVAVGEVRISFAGSEALHETISTTLGELRQPVEDLLDGAAHGAARRLAAAGPTQGSGDTPGQNHDHHSHDRRTRISGLRRVSRPTSPWSEIAH
jgi:hypothetical protein